jgi:hypothetical protein
MNNGAGQIHIALMGDPTLRMHVVAPPVGLVAMSESSQANLEWRPPTDAVMGFHVYRGATPNGPFTRLTSVPITATSYTDAHPFPDSTYMVRALKLETSGSGSYYNLSGGVFVTLPGIQAVPAVASRSKLGEESTATSVSQLGGHSTNSVPQMIERTVTTGGSS